MTTYVVCDDCGKEVRPCGLSGHRRFVHEKEPVAKPKPPLPLPPPTYDAGCGPHVDDMARADPLACPWMGCSVVATTVAERNQHVLYDCPRRRPPRDTDDDWRTGNNRYVPTGRLFREALQ